MMTAVIAPRGPAVSPRRLAVIRSCRGRRLLGPWWTACLRSTGGGAPLRLRLGIVLSVPLPAVLGELCFVGERNAQHLYDLRPVGVCLAPSASCGLPAGGSDEVRPFSSEVGQFLQRAP